MHGKLSSLAAAVVCTLAAAAAGSTTNVQVRAGSGWVDSGVDIGPGDAMGITAEGTLQYADAQPCGPAGMARGWKDLLRVMPYNDAGRGALLGKYRCAARSWPNRIAASRR